MLCTMCTVQCVQKLRGMFAEETTMVKDFVVLVQDVSDNVKVMILFCSLLF